MGSNMTFKEFCDSLTKQIENSYDVGVSIPEAEKLAAKFLHGMIMVTEALRTQDLDRRMKKRGLKAIKSAVRTEEIKKHDKKPAEGVLEDVVNLNPIVTAEEEAFDLADVEVQYLENHLSIFKEAHLYFRSVAKGKFE